MRRQQYHDRVTVLNAPEVSGYGGQTLRDWEHAVATANVPANVQPSRTLSGSTEDTDRQNVTVTRWLMFCDPEVPLDSGSRVLWDDPDRPLEVQGAPGVMKHRGVPHHLEAALRRVTEQVVDA